MKSKISLALVLFCCTILFGCAGDNDDDGNDNDTPSYNLTDLCTNDSYDTENAKYLTNTMYKILGMLNDLSRVDSHGDFYSDIVERFSSSEADLAGYFEELVVQYRDENNLFFEYAWHDTYYIFYSEDLSQIINSFYIHVTDAFVTLDRNVFCDAKEENLLAYIDSAYMAFGSGAEGTRDNYFSSHEFNGDKSVTIGYVLQALGCTNIVIYGPSGQGLPTSDSTTSVIFDPTEMLISRLGMDYVVPVEELLEEINNNEQLQIYLTIN